MKTNILKNTITKAALVALAVTGLSSPRASAQNDNFAPGDLVLYFLQFGGSNTVMVNLGAAYTYRDANANILNIANVGGTLTGVGSAGYPSNWYDDPTIFWGLGAVRSNSTSTTAQVNGDPGRTMYVSSQRTAVGTEGAASSAGWTVDSNGSMTTGANGIIQMQNRLEIISLTTTLVEGTASSFVDDQNSFNILGSPTDSFGVFPGGTHSAFSSGPFGTFGGVAAEGAVDLYRILATQAPVGTVFDPLVPIREGTFEGTFVIDQAGSVSFIGVPEPATFSLLATGVVFGLVRRRRAPRA